LLNALTCIEIGASVWYIWQIDHKNNVSKAKSLTVPANTLWNPNAMAQLINERIGKKVIFLLNTSQTIIKLSEDSLLAQDLSYEKDGYIINCSIFDNKKMWTSATPKSLPNYLIEMCRLKKIRTGRIQVIDTLDYRITRYLSKLYSSILWILLPQEPGIRLIVLQNGIPLSSYFFSNNPDFRENELTRIWLHESFSPQHAVILSDDKAYEWLNYFLKEKFVELSDSHSHMNFRQAMIMEWVKEIAR